MVLDHIMSLIRVKNSPILFKLTKCIGLNKQINNNMKKLNKEQTDMLIDAARNAGISMNTIIAVTECTKEQAVDLIVKQYDIYTNYLIWQQKDINYN